MILRRENVARRPAHFGAQSDQCFDQHGRLDGHVQGTGDARTLERLARRELLANGHEARHFGFGDADFLASPIGKGEVGDHVVGELSHSCSP